MALSKVGSNQIDSAASLTVSGNVKLDGNVGAKVRPGLLPVP